MNYLSKIEDYFSSDLKGSDLDSFNNDLAHNPKLRMRMEMYREAYNLSIIQEHVLGTEIRTMIEFEFSAEMYLTVLNYKEKKEMDFHDQPRVPNRVP